MEQVQESYHSVTEAKADLEVRCVLRVHVYMQCVLRIRLEFQLGMFSSVRLIVRIARHQLVSIGHTI